MGSRVLHTATNPHVTDLGLASATATNFSPAQSESLVREMNLRTTYRLVLKSETAWSRIPGSKPNFRKFKIQVCPCILQLEPIPSRNHKELVASLCFGLRSGKIQHCWVWCWVWNWSSEWNQKWHPRIGGEEKDFKSSLKMRLLSFAKYWNNMGVPNCKMHITSTIESNRGKETVIKARTWESWNLDSISGWTWVNHLPQFPHL